MSLAPAGRSVSACEMSALNRTRTRVLAAKVVGQVHGLVGRDHVVGQAV